ncbi:MAG: YgfZ/GcvT domain-containing protein [Micrococcales bacterium]
MIENPLIQQRELLAGKAIAKLDRIVIEITGEDRLSWLHNMLSQNILNASVGQSLEALLLDAQGHVLADVHLMIQTDAVIGILSDAESEALLDWFQKAKFRSKVAWQILDVQVYGSWGASVSQQSWQDRWPHQVAGGHRYGKVSAEPWEYFENLGYQGDFEVVPESAIDALRIAAHRPSFNEIDEKTLPHELELLATAVHLTKGCYRGQETVAKVHNLGHPPRRLVMLHLDGSGHLLPEVGSTVSFNSVSKGRVTSVGQHHEMGPIALAVISRSVPEDATLEIDSVAATQEVIVPASAGATVERRTVPKKSLL